MSWTTAQTYRRDLCVVVAGIIAITLLGWAYLIDAASPGHAGHHHGVVAWDAGQLILGMTMWTVMMIAMMLPTATPMLLTFTRLQHRRHSAPTALRMVWLFVGGYLFVWTLFSLLAASAQWALYGAGQMTSAMGRVSPLLGGVLLLVAGIFQLTGLKDACLNGCRSPLAFLLNEWRPGFQGAWHMGVRHGVYCVGCCWLLMLLMFAGGVMNLAWMAAITLFVLLEKLLSPSRWFERASSALLLTVGMLTIFINL